MDNSSMPVLIGPPSPPVPGKAHLPYFPKMIAETCNFPLQICNSAHFLYIQTCSSPSLYIRVMKWPGFDNRFAGAGNWGLARVD